MSRTYPDYENPTMIYNAQNQWTIVDASDVDAFLAIGWLAAPTGDIHTAPTECPDMPELPAGAPEPKKKTKAKE